MTEQDILNSGWIKYGDVYGVAGVFKYQDFRLKQFQLTHIITTNRYIVQVQRDYADAFEDRYYAGWIDTMEQLLTIMECLKIQP